MTDLPETKAWKQIFVNTILFVNLAMPELSGSWKPPANKNMVLEHKVIPVVKWGKLTQAQKIEDLKTKKIKLTGNTDFVSPFSSEFKALTQVGTDITTAGNKLQDRLQKLPFSRKNLADAITVLKGDVDNWCAMVKIKVDNVSPAEGVRICNDAGFEHKIITVRSPRKNEVKQGTESGTMYVYAEIAGFHQWQESTDAAHAIIVALDPTRGGILEVKGRTPKQEYCYRWRLVLSKGRYGDWSPWYPGTPQ
jgi:hypothetical protein